MTCMREKLQALKALGFPALNGTATSTITWDIGGRTLCQRATKNILSYWVGILLHGMRGWSLHRKTNTGTISRFLRGLQPGNYVIQAICGMGSQWRSGAVDSLKIDVNK